MRLPTRLAVSFAALALFAACASDDDDGRSVATTPDIITGSAAGETGPAATGPGDTQDTEPTDTGPVGTDEPAGIQPDGFTTATVRVTKADGEVCEVCMWLADDGNERGRGLMGVTDLGAPAGMAFVFRESVDGAFFMFDTPIPLSIAWFATDGAFVSTTDMEPCATAAADCERYRAGGEFQLAIEVFAGDLTDVGLGPGSTAEVLTGTESPECVATS